MRSAVTEFLRETSAQDVVATNRGEMLFQTARGGLHDNANFRSGSGPKIPDECAKTIFVYVRSRGFYIYIGFEEACA